VHTLQELIKHLSGEILIEPLDHTVLPKPEREHHVDFADIIGQEVAKRGLLIAAAGGHNVAMYGPPGTGKTMLAQACRGLLPPLSQEAIFEVTCIHSIAGTLEGPVCVVPPFRSPHHTASYVSIIGGGSHPRPGEITLAHRGLLFLDEFPEFDPQVIESLRQPLEDRVIHISRANGTAIFPANFMLVTAMNPCPCGYYGSPVRTCICPDMQVKRYQQRLSGPIVDRIDIWLPVEHIAYEKFASSYTASSPSMTSTQARAIVASARQRQEKRFASGTLLNAHMNTRTLSHISLTPAVQTLLIESARALSMSPRSYHRMIKLAQTIADLDESDTLEEHHILEALQYRPKLH
jgi:magnesium chelatase family protein